LDLPGLLELLQRLFLYKFSTDEIHRLRSIKQETQEYNAQRQTKCQRISEMTEFLDMQSSIILNMTSLL